MDFLWVNLSTALTQKIINHENISLLKVGMRNQIVMLNFYYKCQ